MNGTTTDKNVVLVTGAGSGIGRAVAQFWRARVTAYTQA